MKVGVYLGKAAPHSGGGYTFIDDIIKSLVSIAHETSHEFILFCEEDEEEHKPWDNLEFIQLPPAIGHGRNEKIFNKFLGRTRFYKESAIERRNKIIRKSGIEMVFNVWPFQCLSLDIPYIMIVWDLQHRLQPYFPEVSSGSEWDKRERIFGTSLRRAAFVIAGTKAGSEEIQRFYQIPAERIRILKHPTPDFALNASSDDNNNVFIKYGLPEEYMFYPAQFWPHKNHAGLIHVLVRLRDEYDMRMPAVFVGSDKGNLAYVKSLISKFGLENQVHILGFVPVEDIISIYLNAFALIYLTYFGPENLPPLEAFALGCPVIASNISGAQEQLGESALLVDPSNEKQIAQAVIRLYKDAELRTKLIEKGRARAREFTGNDFVRGIFSILNEFEPLRRCWGKGYS